VYNYSVFVLQCCHFSYASKLPRYNVRIADMTYTMMGTFKSTLYQQEYP